MPSAVQPRRVWVTFSPRPIPPRDLAYVNAAPVENEFACPCSSGPRCRFGVRSPSQVSLLNWKAVDHCVDLHWSGNQDEWLGRRHRNEPWCRIDIVLPVLTPFVAIIEEFRAARPDGSVSWRGPNAPCRADRIEPSRFFSLVHIIEDHMLPSSGARN